MIGNAVKVMRIATGEEADDVPEDGKGPAAKVARQPGREGSGTSLERQAA